MDDAVFPTDYVALDLETTGFYPNSCAITEIGAVRMREGHVVDQFQQLVNPLRPIPRQMTTLTGITDAMVADLDPIDEVLPDSSHGFAARLPVPPLSRLWAITSASICDSSIQRRHIAGCGFACADYDTMQISRALFPRSGIPVWPT